MSSTSKPIKIPLTEEDRRARLERKKLEKHYSKKTLEMSNRVKNGKKDHDKMVDAKIRQRVEAQEAASPDPRIRAAAARRTADREAAAHRAKVEAAQKAEDLLARMRKPAAKKPAAQAATTKKSAAQEASDKKPATQEASDKKSATQKATDKKPAAKKGK